MGGCVIEGLSASGWVYVGFCVLSVPIVNEAEMEDSLRSTTLLL